MVSNSEKAAYLSILQQEVDKLINESKSHHDNTSRYEALRNIIDLISQEEEFNLRFDEFSTMIISMAQLNFSHRLDVTSGDDLFGYIATSLNLLNEELEHRAAPRHFLEEVIELVPDCTIITNEDGHIYSFNSAAQMLLGYDKKDLSCKSIFHIFKNLNPADHQFDNEVQTTINSKDGKQITVSVTVKKVKGNNDTANGLLFTITNKQEG